MTPRVEVALWRIPEDGDPVHIVIDGAVYTGTIVNAERLLMLAEAGEDD